MRVGLSGLDIKSVGGGLDRYAKDLYYGLKNRGIDCEPIWVEHPKLFLGKTIHSFVSMSLEVAKRAKEFDIVHATHPGMAVAFPFLPDKVRTVVTIHDIIPLQNPSTINMPTGIKNRVFNVFNYVVCCFWYEACKNADRVIAVSSQTRGDLVERGWDESKIRVVPEYVREKFKPVGGVGEKTVGYLGPITFRKGVHYAIEAFSYLASMDDHMKFRICGKVDNVKYWNYLQDLVRGKEFGDRVKFKGFIPEEDIVKTYNKFSCMLYPCVADGFGLPILEATSCNVPVITRKDARIPHEVKSMTVEATSPMDMAKKAESLLAVDKYREEIVGRGRTKAKEFTEEKTVSGTISVYKELVGM